MSKELIQGNCTLDGLTEGNEGFEKLSIENYLENLFNNNYGLSKQIMLEISLIISFNELIEFFNEKNSLKPLISFVNKYKKSLFKRFGSGVGEEEIKKELKLLISNYIPDILNFHSEIERISLKELDKIYRAVSKLNQIIYG